MTDKIVDRKLIFSQQKSDEEQLRIHKKRKKSSRQIKGSYKTDGYGHKLQRNVLYDCEDQQQYKFQAIAVINTKYPQQKELEDQVKKEDNKIFSEIKVEDQYETDRGQQAYQSIRNTSEMLYKFDIESSEDQDIINNHPKQSILDIQNIQKQITKSTYKRQQNKNYSLNSLKIISYKQTDISQTKNQFVRNNPKQRQMIQCRIEINNNGLNYLYPKLNMFLLQNGQHVLSSKKQSGSFGANYYVSTKNSDLIQKDQSYIGKIRSTKNQNIFNIFQKIGKTKRCQKCLVATVCIDVHQTTRSITVYLLKNALNYYSLKYYSKSSNLSLDYLYQIDQNKQLMHILKTKEPVWSNKDRNFQMNFYGKVKQPSIYNFILEDTLTRQQVMLFGKVIHNIYAVNFSYPLSPWIAIAICTAQLQVN